MLETLTVVHDPVFDAATVRSRRCGWGRPAPRRLASADFAVINAVKVPPDAAPGLLDLRKLLTPLLLLLLAPLGVCLGVWLVRWVQATWFYRLADAGMLFTGMSFTGMSFTGMSFTGVSCTGLSCTGVQLLPDAWR